MRRLAPVRWLRARPFVADAILAALLSLPMIAGAIASHRDPAELCLALAATWALAWRRQHPLPVLAVGGVATAAAEVIYGSSASGISVAIALYSAAAHAPGRQSFLALEMATVAVPLVVLAGDGPFFPNLVGDYLSFGAAWVLGDSLRSRRAYLAQLEERARRAEADREEMAARAVAAERTHIARELHDVVAHSVSVMVVQAGAARRLVETNPAVVTEALTTIEQTGRSALDEMRRLLGVLRNVEGSDGAADRAPQPGIGNVVDLVASVQEAGLPVELHVEGDVHSLAPGLDLSAYRIVQEALTNVLKHAGPTTAEVRLCYGERDLEVRITDEGRGSAADHTKSTGHGLVGMRERVSVFGGELIAGPRSGGGFEVRARLPLDSR